MVRNSQDSSFKSRVSLNILMNMVRTVLTAVIGLLMVPYYLNELGVSVYAIIPLSTSITAYVLSLTDPLSASFARYMFNAVKKNDVDEMNRTYNSAVFGMGRIIIYLIPICLIISYLAPYIFSIGGARYEEVQTMFALILLSSMIITFSSCIGCVFEAYNKMYITYTIRTVYIVMQVILIVALFVTCEPSLTFIGVAYFIAAVVMFAIMALCTKRVCPALRISRRYFDRDILRKELRLGMWIVISSIGGMLYIDASLIICNIMMGSAEQGVFAIAVNVVSMTGTAASSIAGVVLPLIYDSYLKRDMNEMMHTVKFFIKFVGCIIACPVAFILVFLPQIIELWIGIGYESIYPMLYVMLPTYIFVCSVKPLNDVYTAFERVRPYAVIMVMFGTMNIVLAILVTWITDWGTQGIIWVWVISILATHLGFTVMFCAYLMKVRSTKLYTSVFSCWIPFLALVLLGYVFNMFLTMPVSWFAVIVSFGIVFVIYTVIILRFGFSDREKGMMKTFLPRSVQKVLKLE